MSNMSKTSNVHRMFLWMRWNLSELEAAQARLADREYWALAFIVSGSILLGGLLLISVFLMSVLK